MSKNDKRPFKGKSLTHFANDYTIIDLETTGLSPQHDDIIEIAAIKVIDNKIVKTYQQLVNPGYEIDKYITELTGITNEMLSSAPKFENVINEILDFISNDIIVGHNVNFDINFLYDNILMYKNKSLSNDYIDTMRFARKLCKELNHHRLIDLTQHFNIDVQEYHRALSDCKSTYLIYNELKKIALVQFNNLDEFFKSFNYQYSKKDIIATVNEFDVTHPLFNKKCIFTGKLEKMTRKEAEQIVVNYGGILESSTVTKETNYLIMGNNDYCPTIKDGKSNKQKTAEKYILQGCDLQILTEETFYDLIFQDGLNSDSNSTNHSYTEDDLLNFIKNHIDGNFLKYSDLIIKENKGNYKSIIIVLEPTVWRFNDTKEKAFAKFSIDSKNNYIAFPSAAKKIFDEINLKYFTVKPDTYLRIDINNFIASPEDIITKTINKLFIRTFNYPSFGCCGKYKECEEKGYCVHDDLIYANVACQYKKLIENSVNKEKHQ